MSHHSTNASAFLPGRIPARSVLLPTSILFTLVLILICSCGGSSSRHSGGIYQVPLPQEQVTQQPAAGTTGKPNNVLQPAGSQITYGGGTSANKSLTLAPDVDALFVDIEPAEGGFVFESQVNISTKLLVTDYDENAISKLAGLRIGKFTVNGETYPATFTAEEDGFRVSLDGFSLSNPGYYSALVALYDDEGRHYVQGWTFEYDPNPPGLWGVSRMYEDGPDGNGHHVGYTIIMDDEVKPGHYPLFADINNWQLTDPVTLQQIPIRAIDFEPRLINMINVYCDETFWENNIADAIFRCPELPGYSINSQEYTGSKSTSYVETFPCGPPCGPPTDPPGIEGGGDNIQEYEPQELIPNVNLNCCSPDICEIEIISDAQCCNPMIKVSTGGCLDCNFWAVYAYDCTKKLGPADVHNPRPGETFPFEDKRPEVPCFTNSTIGNAYLLKRDYFDTMPMMIFRPDWKSKYKMVIGKRYYDLQAGEWKECFSWVSDEVQAGDLDNPIVSGQIISGTTMADELSNGGQCVRYSGNLGYLPFEATLNEYEQGCGPVLKIDVQDKCFDHRTSPYTNEELANLFRTEFHRIPKKVWDDSQYWDPEGFHDILWERQLYGVGNCAYICDHTSYPDCSAEDPSDSLQHFTYYYLLPRDVEPFTVMVESSCPHVVAGGSQYVEDCATYQSWIVRDRQFTGGTIGTSFNWSTVFYEQGNHAASVWDTSDTGIYRRKMGEDFGKPVTSAQFIKTNFDKGCEIVPDLNQLEKINPAQLLQNPTPFAVHYHWTQNKSMPGAEISDGPKLRMLLNPLNPEDYPGGFPSGYTPLGFPVAYPDGKVVAEPDPTCRCFLDDTGVGSECLYIESGYIIFPCQILAVDEAYMEATTRCNDPEDLEAWPIGDPTNEILSQYVFGGFEKPMDGAWVIEELQNYYRTDMDDDRKILKNPMVSGDEECTVSWPYFGPCREEDGPAPFAECKIKCCEQPSSIEIYIKAAEWKPIEDCRNAVDEGFPSYNGYGVGNSFEEDDPFGGKGNWKTNIAADPTDEKWYPPVYIGYSRENLPQHDVDSEEHIHNDYADQDPVSEFNESGHDWFTILGIQPPDDDTANDIVRATNLNPKRFTAVDEVIKADETQPEFTIAWDGRQWMLDRGVMKYTHTTQEIVGYDMIDVAHENLDALSYMDPSDGGSLMYPPGKYVLYADISMPHGSATICLGEIYLAYGGQVIDGLGSMSARSDYAEVRTQQNNAGVETQFVIGERYLYPPWPPHKIGVVTALTATEYTSNLHTFQHDKNWDEMTNWPLQPVSKDLVILAECHGLQALGHFSPQVHIGYEHYAWGEWMIPWMREFYYYFLDPCHETIHQAYIDANTAMSQTPDFKGKKVGDYLEVMGNKRSYYPTMVPADLSDPGEGNNRSIDHDNFEKTTQD